MYQNFLDWVNCPSCKKILDLKIFEISDDRVKNGLLVCKCGGVYPVIDFIPRIYASAPVDHEYFFENNKSQISKHIEYDFHEIEKRALLFSTGFKQVQTKFNVQWDKFGENERFFGKDKKEILEFLEKYMMYPGETIDNLKGKLVLDAGCGHGVYTLNLAEKEVNIIGLDITDSAVVKTFNRTKGFLNAHIVQGDVLHNPFRQGMFDYIFSEGVIHHTPNTRMAFHMLSMLVKPGGMLAIWVYPVRSALWEITQSFLRRITTRLPSPLLYYLCYIPVPLLWLFKAYSGTSLSSSSWKECAQVVWDFYSPQYQTHHTETEVRQWFLEEGFKDVMFLEDPVGAVGTRL